MAEVIFRAGKIAIKSLVLIFTVLLILYFFHAAVADQQDASTSVSSDMSYEQTQDCVVQRNEIVSARDENTRLWEIVKEVEVEDPETGQRTIEQRVSYIEEKGCGICYKDQAGNWQITDTSWVETESGFVMEKAGYVLEMGNTADSMLGYFVDGTQMNLWASELQADDGVNTQSIAHVGVVAGQIDPNNPNKLVFTDAFGNGIDLELEAKPGGFHQNVIFRNKPVLPAGFSVQSTEYKLFTELGLNTLKSTVGADRGFVKYKNQQEETVKTKLENIDWTGRVKLDISFVQTNENGKSKTLHRFGESDILETNKSEGKLKYKKKAVAEKEIVCDSEMGKTYLVESLNADILENCSYPVIWDYQSISGTLTEDEIWYADKTYYISANLYVGDFQTWTQDDQVMLIIEPGTIVKLNDDVEVDACWGGIIAEGKPFEYIIFTSKHDDSIGDVITGSDGDPNYLDWDEITAYDNSSFSFCKIGYNDHLSLTTYYNSFSSPIKNNIFRRTNGLIVGWESDSNIKVFNNLFYDCRYAITYIPYSSYQQGLSIFNNTFENISEKAIWNYGTSNSDYKIKNNLYSNCNFGIWAYSGSTPDESNNAFYNCNYRTTGFTQHVTDVNVPASPYGFTFINLGEYYLNTDPNGGELLKNAGSANTNDPNLYGSNWQNWSIYHVPDDGHIFDSNSLIASDTTWQPNYVTCDANEVAIGYHHPRVDYVIDGGIVTVNATSGQATLSINPKTVISVRDASNSHLYIGTNGGVTSIGTPDGYVSWVDQGMSGQSLSSVSRSSTNTAVSGSSTSIDFSFNKWLGRGVYLSSSTANFYDNIFSLNYYGLDVNGGTYEINNCLFANNSVGLYSRDGTITINNSTFDRNEDAVFSNQSPTLYLKNSLFSDNTDALDYSVSSPTINENNNVFFSNTTNLEGSSLDSSDWAYPQESPAGLLNGNPFDPNWTDFDDRFHLDSNSYAIGNGYDPCSIGMPGYTTQLAGTIDTSPIDIGYHYATTVQTDIEGLYDYLEYWMGTDHNDIDTDDDGLVDGYDGIVDADSYPGGVDSDSDGYVDGELELGTDPLDNDSDDDGILDGLEVGTYNTDPLDSDSDGDGLSDGIEVLLYSTDPLDSDSDDDNLNDYAEIMTYETDPLDSDSDDDGLSDGSEVNTYLTDPLDADSDNDGMTDGWEADYGLSPTSATDKETDSDSDGHVNVSEFLHGSRPNDVNDIPVQNVTIKVPNPATTIQKAINWSIDGDVVKVYTGLYKENINFDGKTIVLTSSDPNNWQTVQKTIINGEDAAPVTFNSSEDPNSIIQGFKIIQSSSSSEYPGILVSNSSPTIRHCVVDKRVDSSGSEYIHKYGIECSSGSPYISNNIIRFCKWAAIYTTSTTPPTIKNSLFYENNAGIRMLYANASAVIRNNTIVNNASKGIHVTDSQVEPDITNCILWGNNSGENEDLKGDCSGKYSCIQSSLDIGDPNLTYNISQNPNFINEYDYNFCLNQFSPCIDAGDPSQSYIGEADFENNIRSIRTVDIGADEVYEVHNSSQDKWYRSVSSAITDANDFETLIVYPGTYYESIDFGGKSITVTGSDITSWDIIDKTIIRSDGQNDVVTFDNSEDPNSVITGLTLVNGINGVYIEDANPVVSWCKIEGNSSHGVYCNYLLEPPYIHHNKIGNNTEYGVYVANGCPPKLEYNSICYNKDGIRYKNTTQDIRILNNTIAENEGNGFYIDPNSTCPEINSCLFFDNDANDVMNNTCVWYSGCQDSIIQLQGNVLVDPNNKPTKYQSYEYHHLVGSALNTSADPAIDRTNELDLSYEAVLNTSMGSEDISEIYVYADISTGNRSGVDWYNAYSSLETALGLMTNDRAHDDIDRIYVAKRDGNAPYVPISVPTGKAYCFGFQLTEIVHSVEIYGGLTYDQDINENYLATRVVEEESDTTILSGDISGNDDGFDNYEDNAMCILWLEDIDNTILIDGFTIKGGRNSERTEPFAEGNGGGGIYSNLVEKLKIKNCIIKDNGGGGQGGGCYVKETDIEIIDTKFDNNRSLLGGALGVLNASISITGSTFQNHTEESCLYLIHLANYNQNAILVIDETVFLNNRNAWVWMRVGYPNVILQKTKFHGNQSLGINAHNLIITESVFSDNSHVSLNCTTSAVVNNSVFFDNTASSSILGSNSDGAELNVNNCIFLNNTLNNIDSAVIKSSGSESSATIYNNIIWGNRDSVDIIQDPIDATIEIIKYCCIETNSPPSTCFNSDPKFVDDTDPGGPTNDKWFTNECGLMLQSDSPCIDAADGSKAPYYDILKVARVDNLFIIPDTGTGSPSYADIGAYEYINTDDTDYDGLLDSWEMTYFGNLDYDPLDDPDGDGISNQDEYFYELDPSTANDDGDSLPDAWELQYFGDLDEGDSHPSEPEDDSDKLTNSQEYVYGLDPTKDNRGDFWTEYAYDDAGNITGQTKYEVVWDETTQTSTISELTETLSQYDTLNRKTIERQLENPGGSTGTADKMTVSFYDLTGNVLTTLFKASTNTSTTAYETGDIMTRYQYDLFGRMTKVFDALDISTDYEYDLEGRMTKTTLDGSLETEYVYDSAGRAITMTDPADNYVVTDYDSRGKAVKKIAYNASATAVNQQRIEYNPLGELTRQAVILNPASDSNINTVSDKVTDYENTYNSSKDRYTYSYVGNMTVTTKSSTSDSDISGKGLPTVVTQGKAAGQSYVEQRNLYDLAGRLTTRISDNYEYDSTGATHAIAFSTTTDMLYDDYGRMTASVQDGDTELTTAYSYNGMNQKVMEINPEDVTTAYYYDGFGKMEKKVEDVDGFDRETLYEYDRLGRMVTISAINTGGLTQQTSYDYDDAGHVTTITYPDTGSITYAYNEIGKVIKREDQEDITTYYSYDNLGNLTLKSVDEVGDGAPYDMYEHYAYDARGLMTAASKGDNGNKDDVAISEFLYDGLGYLTQHDQEILDSGTTKSVLYDRDQSGQAIEIEYPDGNSTTMTYTYTSMGQLDTISRGATPTQLVDYDYYGRYVAERTYTQNSVTFAPEYDSFGRVTTHKTENASDAGVDFTYTYDNNSNILSKVFHHRQGHTVDPYNYYTYDNLDRVTDADYLVTMLTEDEEFDYDLLGNRQTYETRENYEYSYASNLVNEYTDIFVLGNYSHWKLDESSGTDASDAVGSNDGTINGDPTWQSTGGQIEGALELDGTNDYINCGNDLSLQLTDKLTISVWINSDQSAGQSDFYAVAGKSSDSNWEDGWGLYLNDSKVKFYVDHFSNNCASYNFTSTSSWHHIVGVFDKDAASSQVRIFVDGQEGTSDSFTSSLSDGGDFIIGRITAGLTGYDFDGSIDNVILFDEALTETQVKQLYHTGLSTIPAHDNCGNLITDSMGYQYEYDYENRVTKVKDDQSSTVSEMTYDALGRRVQLVDTADTVTTRYYYDGDRVLLEQEDAGSGFADARYFVYGNYIDEMLVMVDDLDTTPVDHYAGHDHLYSVVVLFDGSGNVIERVEYDAYGTPTVYNSDFTQSYDVSQQGNPYLFTGRRLDAFDTNDALTIYYYRARHFDPQTGRFMQRDPISNRNFMHLSSILINTYRYALNNPLTRIDSFGLTSEVVTTTSRGWDECNCENFCYLHYHTTRKRQVFVTFLVGEGARESLLERIARWILAILEGAVGASTPTFATGDDYLLPGVAECDVIRTLEYHRDCKKHRIYNRKHSRKVDCGKAEIADFLSAEYHLRDWEHSEAERELFRRTISRLKGRFRSKPIRIDRKCVGNMDEDYSF